MRQNILIFAGILGILSGVLFMLQGLGIVRWPQTSSMIDSHVWIYRGLALAVAGAILIGGVRLVPPAPSARRQGAPGVIGRS